MEIGDRLEFELVKSKNPCSCEGCDVWLSDCVICEHCGDNIFKLLPKQNTITFENAPANILHDGSGEPTMLELRPLITAENLQRCLEIVNSHKDVKVDVVVRWEE